MHCVLLVHGFIMIHTRRYSYKSVLQRGAMTKYFLFYFQNNMKSFGRGCGRVSGGKHFERVKILINEHNVEVKNNCTFVNF